MEIKPEIRTALFSMYSGDLGFFVRSVGECRQYPPNHQRVKIAPFAQIFWCISGSGEFQLGGGCFRLKPGWVWYYPPGSLHSYVPDQEGFHYRWLTLDGPQAGNLFSALGISPGAMRAGSCPHEPFQNIEANIRKPARQMLILQEAFKILTDIRTPRRIRANSRRPDLAEELKRVVDEEFDDPQLNVDVLAARIDRHRVTAGRVFRSRYGINLSDYLINVRCQEALSLLSDTDIPPAQLPELCGFSSKTYFYRVIRKITGETPGELRQTRRKGNMPSPERK